LWYDCAIVIGMATISDILRARLAGSEYAVAKALDVNYRTLKLFSTGQREPSSGLIDRLAEYFELTVVPKKSGRRRRSPKQSSKA
jgi:hypothetical protein